MRRALVATTAVALIVAACTTPGTTTPDGGTGSGVTYDVQVDATIPAFNLEAFSYFPNELKAHPGDTIRFTSIDRGEPHTVTFGTLIDDAVKAMAQVPKDAPPGPPPPAVLKVPQGQSFTPSGVDLRQSAMQSCFLASGDPPPRDACTKDQQKQPEFTGTQTFYNSGFMPGRAVFSVKLASGAKPGSYTFLCLFHGPEMSGKVVVVDKGEPAQSPDEVNANGRDRLNKLVQALQPAANAAKLAGTSDVIAGAGDPAVHEGFITEFFPKTVSVPVGGSLTWRISVGHTISFNAPSDAVDFVVKATDGSFHLNNKAVFNVGWPGQPLPPLFGLDPPPGAAAPPPPVPAPPGASPPVPPPFAADAGVWDGRGYRSSGIIFQFDPRQAVTYKVTFAGAGTYTYKCLIHIDMEGTVKVGQ